MANTLPILKILLVDDETKELKVSKKILTNVMNQFVTSEFLINIITAENDVQVRDFYKDETQLQAVLLDWELAGSNSNLVNPTPELLVWMKSFRPCIPVYILTKSSDGFEIVVKSKALSDGFFSKKLLKSNPEDILNRIIGDFNNRRTAPFWEAFKKYVDEFSDSWHTPGHSRGASFKNSDYLRQFYEYWGHKTFAADLSVSVEHLGSLLDSTSFIKEAQEKAANTFGVQHTFFATNGSSTSNKIMLQSIMKPGDVVVIDRNCHKSVHYACIQSGADVKYLTSEYNSEFGIFAPPSLKEIEGKLSSIVDVKVIVITGCTYDGLLIDVKRVVALAKKYSTETNRIKVFIDEAWFAYSGFHPAYYEYSAIRAGADYITHSTHKVLSAFSQASYLHINDPEFDEDFFREIFNIYTSTSPQYQIIASLDVASMQMNLEGFKLLERARENAERFIEEVNKNLKYIKVLDKEAMLDGFTSIASDNIGHDILKVTLDLRDLGMPLEDVLKQLRSEGKLEIEKTTASTIMVLFTIGIEQDRMFRLFQALSKLDLNATPSKKEMNSALQISIPEIELEMRPYDAFYSKACVAMSIASIQGFIEQGEQFLSSRLVTPYPPGIPMLVPGQLIHTEHLKILIEYLANGTEIHGCRNKIIYVIPFQKSLNNESIS